jgi:hypothetical protein
MATIISKIFTDIYINNEIVRLNHEILKCDSNIEFLSKEISHLENDSHRANDRIWSVYQTLNPASKDDVFRVEYTYCREYRDKIAEIDKRISQNESEKERLNKQKKDYDAQKRELEALLPKTEEQRAEEHYQRLIKAKNEASSEEDYQYLAEQFNYMDGYKNTIELANECDNQYRKHKDVRERQERAEKQRIFEQKRAEELRRKERERLEAEEQVRRRQEIKRNKRNRIITLSILWGIPSGMVFAIVSTIAKSNISLDHISYIVCFLAIALGILGFIAGSANDSLSAGCGTGCGGLIGGGLITIILGVVATSVSPIVFIIIGIVVGSLVGMSIGLFDI